MNGLKVVNDLSPRQWRLYNYYKDQHDKDPHKWLSHKEIYEDMHYYYDDYAFLNPSTDWNNQKARREITDDILALKKSEVIHHIILSDHRGSKIANKEEAGETLFSERISILSSLKRNGNQIKKIGLDGQYRIVFNKEKAVYEVFRKIPSSG